MVGNVGEIGHNFSRRQSSSITTINSPRRLSRSADSREFDSLMDFPKLLQRGSSFKSASPARYQNAHYTNVRDSARSACQRRIIVWMTLLFCLSCLLILWFSGSLWRSSSSHGLLQGYGMVIDIGREEARINVIWFEEGGEGVDVKVVGSEGSVGRLDVEAAGGGYDVSDSLDRLVEYARRIVPEVEWPRTRVYVVGTGGMEWVPALNRDVLLEECREVIHGSGFQFHDEWATVIYGRDEGVYEWVAANYARGMAQSGTADTIGVLTLGDESAQVTFVAEETPPSEYLHQVELWGTTYNLYSYSFENLGLDTASKSLLKILHARTAAPSIDGSETKVVIDPCTPRGYVGPNHEGLAGARGDITTAVNVHSTVFMGNFTACRAESLALLQQGQDACLDTNCPIGAIFVPELYGNFIATKNFHLALKYFNLPAMASIADLAAAGEKYCGQREGVHNDLFPEYKEVRKPCFSAAFIVAFLHDSLSLPVDGNKVMFTDVVNSVPVEWTLGFFLTHLLEEKAGSSHPIVIFGEFFGNIALFVGLLALVGALLWFVTRWRRPQLKTIYDLEKGRYFTTASRGR